jgi:hypothetical protein
MFQSIEYKRYFGYNVATKLYEYEYELIDSDFSCVASAGANADLASVDLASVVAGAVIKEYSKRNLNVAANLVRCFCFCEKKYGWTIAEQIVWAEQYQPLFTPKLKVELDKYMVLV